MTAPRTSGPTPRFFALVPCAGTGQRAAAGGPKQYAMLNGGAVVAHTLHALAQVQRLQATLVVLAPEDAEFEQRVSGFARDWVARRGGATRAASVTNGLRALRERNVADHDWVLVHDAARCLLRPEWVDRLIDACVDDKVGGLLALPVADTLKREVGEAALVVGRRVANTQDRRGLWAAQTPQMFRLGLLEQALAQVGDAVTDESSAIEALGHRPRLVQGEIENLKITWPADLALAARLLESRR